MRILGIDPGLQITGYGCVESPGPGRAPTLVEAGVLRLGRPSPGGSGADAPQDADTPHALGDGRAAASISARLAELDRDLTGVLQRLAPDLVAVEELFAHYKHPATAIVMGHARGVILLTVRKAGLPLAEFRPNMVKKSLTGFGHASKQQVQLAIRDVFRLQDIPKPPDLADALAIALCAANHTEAT